MLIVAQALALTAVASATFVAPPTALATVTSRALPANDRPAAAATKSVRLLSPPAQDGWGGYYDPSGGMGGGGNGQGGPWPDNTGGYYYENDQWQRQGEYPAGDERSDRQRRREYLRRELDRLDAEERGWGPGEEEGEYYASQRGGTDQRALPQQYSSAGGDAWQNAWQGQGQGQDQYYEGQRNFDQGSLTQQYGRERRTGGGYDAPMLDDFWARDPLIGSSFGGISKMMDFFMDPFIDPFGRDGRGGMISPFSSPFGVFRQMDRMMQQMNAEMTEGMGRMLEEARRRLMADPAAAEALGDSLNVGRPVGQSSARSVVNGEAQSRVQLAVPVEGSRGDGLARIVADERGLRELALDIEGGRIDIPLNGRERWEEGRGGPSDSNSDVIDASVVDKEVY